MKRNPDGSQLVPLVALAGAGAAGYFLFYVPWAQRRALEELTRNAILANQKKGMSAADAAAAAVAGACTAGAAVYKMPAAVAGPLCQGVGLVAVKGAQAAAKGAVIVGKLTGKGAKVLGKGVGKGAKVLGKGVGKGAKKAWKSIFGDFDYYSRHF